MMPALLNGCELFVSCNNVCKRKLNVALNNIVRYVRLLYNMGLHDYLRVRTLLFLQKILYTRKLFRLMPEVTFHFFFHAISLWNRTS